MKKTYRYAAWAVVLAASLLSACGGGSDSEVQVLNGTVEEGKAEPAGTAPGADIVLSQPVMKSEFLKNGDRIQVTQTQTVHIDFKKDDLLVGYAPGAPQVNWLYLPSSKQTLREKSFDLRIEVFPTTHPVGVQTTTLRIVNRRADGSGSTYVDLPVEMKIHGLPTVYAGEVAITSGTGAAASPVVLPLDFGALPSPAVAVSVADGNSAAAQWLAVAAAADGKSMILTPKAVDASGHYTGFINVRYQTLGAITDKRIPVSLVATAATPRLRHVSPNRLVPGQAADLLITGEGFLLGDVQAVRVGAQAASRVQRLSDTQLSAHFDQVPGTGDQPVTVTVGERTLELPDALRLAQDVALPMSTLTFGEDVVSVRYDERTLSLFVATAQRIYRMQLVNGVWQTAAVRIKPFQPFELSGDGRQLVFVDSRAVTLLDAATLADAAVKPFPRLSGQPAGYDWVTMMAVMHNGDVLVQFPDADYAKTYTNKIAIYRMHSGILDVSDKKGSSLMTAQSSLRDSAKMVANRSEQPSFTGDYVATTDTFVATTLPSTGISGNRFVVSGDGRRVLLNNDIYDLTTQQKVHVEPGNYYNYYPVLSPDGQHVYLVSEGIGDFLVSGATATFAGAIAVPRDAPDTDWAGITPNGQAILKLGSATTGTIDGRRNLYVIPVR